MFFLHINCLTGNVEVNATSQIIQALDVSVLIQPSAQEISLLPRNIIITVYALTWLPGSVTCLELRLAAQFPYENRHCK